MCPSKIGQKKHNIRYINSTKQSDHTIKFKMILVFWLWIESLIDPLLEQPVFGMQQQQMEGVTSATPTTKKVTLQDDSGSYNHRAIAGNTDDCAVSSKIDGKFECTSTNQMVQFSNLSNMLTQTTGSIATQTMGQTAQMKAATQNTQAGALQAAGQAQKTTGEIQMGIGSTNAVMGAYQIWKAYQHEKNAKEIASKGNAEVEQQTADATNLTNVSGTAQKGKLGYMQGNSTLQNNMIDNFKMNDKAVDFQDMQAEKDAADHMTGDGTQKSAAIADLVKQRNKELSRQKNIVQERLSDVSSESASEQRRVQKAAIMGGIMSMTTGAQQLMSGGFSYSAGEATIKQAQSLANANTNVMSARFAQTLPGTDSKSSTPPTQNAITGNGDTSSSTATDNGASPLPSLTPLPIGFNPSALPSNLPGGPSAGSFKVGVENGGGGGGSDGGSGGGGSTSPESAQGTEDQAPSSVPQVGGVEYTGGGSGGAMLSSGGGKGKGDNGPDLSALLAQFLPKKGDEDKAPHSILEFGSGKTQEQPFSILDKNANLFERIHEAYQEKSKEWHQ